MLYIPPVYTHGHFSPSPAFPADAAWTRAPAAGPAGVSPPARRPFFGTPGHGASQIATPTYRNADGAGPVTSHVDERQSAMSLVASASPYGGAFGGEGAGSRSTVGHMTPSPVSLADNGSSAYAPFGDLLAPAGGMGAPAQDAAHSYARQGLTEVEDEDHQQQRAVDGQSTPSAGPRTTLPTPTVAAQSTLPISKRRRAAAATRCSPPTSSLTRRRGSTGAAGVVASAGSSFGGAGLALADGGALHPGLADVTPGTAAPLRERGAASPCTRGRSAAATGATPPTRAGGASSAAAAAGGASLAGHATAALVSDIMRSTGVGFDGVRREISTQRKELAIMNSQLRSVTKKVDEIAVLADRLTASVVFQRRALVAMSGDITSVLKYVAASGAASSPPTIDGASAVRDAAADGGQMLAATETQNAQWILDLKVCSRSPAASSGSAFDLSCVGVCACSGFL